MNTAAAAGIGLGVMATVAGLVLFGHSLYRNGWRDGALHVAMDLRRYRDDQLGVQPSTHDGVVTVTALNEAALIALYHSHNFRALLTGLPRSSMQATSPAGKGRHHKH